MKKKVEMQNESQKQAFNIPVVMPRLSHFIYKNVSNEEVKIRLHDEIEFEFKDGYLHFYYTFKHGWGNDSRVELIPVPLNGA